MRNFVSLIIGIVFATLTGSAWAEFEIKQVDPSVVRIQHVLVRDGQARFAGHGTGFVISRDGLVVTNNHVIAIDPAKLPAGVKLRFVVPDGSWKRLRRVSIVATFPELDLAVLKVEGLNRSPVVLSLLAFGQSPKKGEKVFAVGFPGAADASAVSALHSTLTSGLVGKIFLGRRRGGQRDRPIIQHEASISPGNSGGPLFNNCNQVVGVNTFVAASKFEVRREKGGRVVARGAAVSGVYYSPHVSSLVTVLKQKGIKFESSSSACLVSKPGQDSMIFVYIGIAALLAVTSLLLALRKPRERVVKVVESYTQMLRRKGEAGTRVSGASPPGRAAVAPGGMVVWELSGTDGSGKAVHIKLTDRQLAAAGEGLVVGRQQTTSDLLLSDPSVSRRHARIRGSGSELNIEDLGSANGTSVDARAIVEGKPVSLSDGAVIEFGDVTLTLSRA